MVSPDIRRSHTSVQLSSPPLSLPDDDIVELRPNQNPNIYQTIRYKNTNKQVHSQIDTIFHPHACQKCALMLEEPYIQCAECEDTFCVLCFSRGAETQHHRNNHSYIVRHDTVQVFPGSGWTAHEEKRLLELLLVYGYGNWEDVSLALKTKTLDECRDHYLRYYFDGIFEQTMGLTSQPYQPITVPYLYRMSSVDPPRFPDQDCVGFKETGGYRCARSEFDTPFDQSAEAVVSNLLMTEIDSTYWEQSNNRDLADKLHCALFRAYNHRLRERVRRHRIMREHGLLQTSRTLGWLAKHADALGDGIVASKYGGTGRFVAFMQLGNAIYFDMLVESLQYAFDMKRYLHRLCEIRKSGVTSFAGGKVYFKLKAKRLVKVRDRRAELFEQLIDWRNFLPSSPNSHLALAALGNLNPMIPRRKASPLEVYGEI
jgi:Myb-like DNA-binding domain